MADLDGSGPGTEPDDPLRNPTPVLSSPARGPRQRRRRIRRGIVTAVVVAVVLGLGVGVTWATVRPNGTTYRTAVVSTGSVSQTVSAAGSLADVTTADAAFAAAGTVSSIDVVVGDTVTAGQVLGTLDTTELASAVQAAETNLTAAKQTLADDTEAQDSAAASSSASAGTPTVSVPVSVQPTPEQPTTQQAASGGGRSGIAGTAGSGSAGSAGAIIAAQNAIVGCQRLVDYLIGKGLAAGTCTPAPASSASSTPSGASAGVFSTTYPGGSSAPNSRVPVSQGCSVILAANGGDSGTGSGPSGGDQPAPPVTVTQTVTTTETVTPTTETSADAEAADGSTDSPTPTTTATATSTGYPRPGSTTPSADAVTRCQYAIASAVDALDNLYSRELALEKLLSSAATASGSEGVGRSGTASVPGAPSRSLTGTRVGSGAGSTAPTGSENAVAATGSGSGSATSGGQLSGASAGQGGQSARVPTAADIAADQAQIDLTDADLAVAQQSAEGATLVSPIGGTVARVDVAVGDHVSAGSTTQTVMIVGRHQYQLTVSIPLNQIDLVSAGQRAAVTVNGVAAPLAGAVTMLGVLDNSATSTPSYPVTVLLDPASQPLFDGAGAAVTIDIGAAAGVVTVPTSAVTITGNQHTVTVLSGTRTSVVPVEIGLVGPELTQITGGLKLGQVVVLANIDEPLPTSSSAGSGRGGSAVLGGGTGAGGRLGGGARFAG